jgi:MYXO-CTERM domain-containing protein
MQEISLVADSVFVPGTFRVALEFHHNGAPSIGRDDDGSIMPGRNFIFTSGLWVQSQVLGLTGDWIIRAFVMDMGGGGPDAGIPGQPDAAPGNPPDAGPGADCLSNADCDIGEYCSETNQCTFDCRMDEDWGATGDEGGCGCRTGGRGAGATGALLGLMVALGFVVTRRRRA